MVIQSLFLRNLNDNVFLKHGEPVRKFAVFFFGHMLTGNRVQKEKITASYQLIAQQSQISFRCLENSDALDVMQTSFCPGHFQYCIRRGDGRKIDTH